MNKDELDQFFGASEGLDIPPIDPAIAAKALSAAPDTAEEMIVQWDAGESLPFVDIAPPYLTLADRLAVEQTTQLPFDHVAVRHGPCVVAVAVARLLVVDHPELGVAIRASDAPSDLDPMTRQHIDNSLRQTVADLDRYDIEKGYYACGGLTPQVERIGVAAGLVIVRHGPKAMVQTGIALSAIFWADNRDVMPYYKEFDVILRAQQERAEEESELVN